MPGTIAPFPRHQFFTNNGDPAASHKLFTYAAGTTDKLATYTDVDLTSANTNPIVLDAAGRAVIFLQPLSYKFVFTTNADSDPPVSPIWTIDNVAAVPSLTGAIDVAGVAGQPITARKVLYLSDGSGGTTAGRWYQADGNFPYASNAAWVGFMVGEASAGTGEGITVRIVGRMTGFSGLTAGVPYYVSTTTGEITATAPTNGSLRSVGVADSTTSLVISPSPKAGNRDRVTAVITTVGNVGAGEDTLHEYVSLAGEMTVNASYYHVIAAGQTANNANAKTLRLRVIEGANNNVALAFVPTASEAGVWTLDAYIIRNAGVGVLTQARAEVGPANGPVSRAGTQVLAGTITWANAVTIRLTGDATTNNDITCTSFIVERHD